MSEEVIPAKTLRMSGISLPPAATQLIDRIGGPRRAMIAGVGVVAVVVILLVARWATAPSWVPAYTDLPLESVGAITERLEAEGIPFQLGGNGTDLMVASTDLARARVALAAEGGLADGGRPGLELFDQPAWGMTDFTQRINYRRALEGELERTIKEMRGVEAVKVSIAMEESTGFRRSGQPSEASVVLELSSGLTPSADMVNGISYLVAASVDGVEADRVMVLDDSGILLSNPYAADSPAALASNELRMRTEVEQYLGRKAQQLVAQIVGGDNVRVQVSADINLDRVERTTEQMSPEGQVLSSEQRSEIVPGAEGGAGSSSVTATYMNTRSVENFSSAVGNVSRLTAAVLVNDKEIVDENGATTYEPRTPEELAQIQTLVASAVGIDATRGDQISVVSFAFDAGVDLEETVSPMDMALRFQRPGIALLALLVTLIIAFRVTRTLKVEPAPEALESGANLNVLFGSDNPTAVDSAAQIDGVLPPPVAMRDKVAAQIDAQPEAAVKMIRTWMREEA